MNELNDRRFPPRQHCSFPYFALMVAVHATVTVSCLDNSVFYCHCETTWNVRRPEA